MASAQVRMTIQWFVPLGSVRAINAALNDLMASTRAQRGCVGCFLTTQIGQRAGFTYVEEWESEEPLKAQVRSERFAKLAQLMETATSQPLVEFTLSDGSHGIEFADEVRRFPGRAS
jgi:quinol monooxygenase YgiN